MQKNISEIPFDFLSHRYHRQRLDEMIDFYAEKSRDLESIHQYQMDCFKHFVSKLNIELSDIRDYIPPANGKIKNLEALLGCLKKQDQSTVLSFRKLRQKRWPTIFRSYYEFTSGSTRDSFGLYRSSHSVQRENLRLRYVLNYYAGHINIQLPSKIIYISHYQGASSYNHVDHVSTPLYLFKRAFNISDVDPLQEFQMLENFVLSGTASSLQSLLEFNNFLINQPSFILSSGEHLPVTLKESLEQHFNCPVYELYVMRECGLIGFQCIENKGFHIFEQDIVLIEGEHGLLYITDMTNDLDLFFNYYTGDKGDIIRHCNCGESFKLLTSLIGRSFGKPVQLTSTIGW